MYDEEVVEGRVYNCGVRFVEGFFNVGLFLFFEFIVSFVVCGLECFGIKNWNRVVRFVGNVFEIFVYDLIEEGFEVKDNDVLWYFVYKKFGVFLLF